MRNLGGVAFVVHQQEVDLTDVVHEELLQAIGKKVASLLVATITDLHNPKSNTRRDSR